MPYPYTNDLGKKVPGLYKPTPILPNLTYEEKDKYLEKLLKDVYSAPKWEDYPKAYFDSAYFDSKYKAKVLGSFDKPAVVELNHPVYSQQSHQIKIIMNLGGLAATDTQVFNSTFQFLDETPVTEDMLSASLDMMFASLKNEIMNKVKKESSK